MPGGVCRIGRWAMPAVALVVVAGIAMGCGGGRTFAAQEFVDEVNAQGVELRLGDPLFTDEEGKELYAVELESLVDLPGSKSSQQDRAGGSLSVYDDPSDADGKLASCESAADLLCYRVSNIVVVLEGGGIAAQRLGVAMQRLSEE
jgi:hypothetical protein